MQYTYYFLLYAIEVMKFYIVYKNYYGFQEKIKGKKEWIILIAGIVIMAFIMKNCNSNISSLFIYISFILLEGNCLFKVPLSKFLIYSFLTMEVLGTLDAMSTVLIEIIVELCGKSGLSFQKIFAFGITVLFIYGVDKLFRKINQKNKIRISMLYVVLFGIIGIRNSALLVFFQKVIEEYGKNIYKVVFLFVTIGMFLDMAVILVLIGLFKVYKEKNNLTIKYLELQNEHYAYLEKREYETKKFRHDIRNHILVLDDLCKKREVEKAEQYIEKMWGRINEVAVSISVNHGIVDAILNQYVNICMDEGISFKVEGHMPLKCRVEAFDLCTIFSNLLSNAIEAERESIKKEIRLEIRYDTDTIYIYIENYYVGERKARNGIVVSHKKDKNKHGYGLLNVQECVEKYNGIFEYEIETDKFKVMIAMKNCIA